MRKKKTKIHTMKTERRKDRLLSAAFLGPSFGGLLLFYILPFFVVIYYAVVDNPVSHNFVFLDNFKQVLQNNAFQRAAKNMAIFSGLSVPLAVVLSLLLACLLEAKIPLRSQFRTFFLSPMMVPVASIVLIWQVAFHYNGAVNEFLSIFGVEKIDWMKSEYNRYVVVLLFLWKNLGYNMILFIAAFGNIPRDVLEMASLEGAGPIRTFFSIKLPYLTPTLLFVTILSLINSFKIFREVYLLTGSYPYDGLYLMQHFMNNMFESMDYQKLCAAALLMAGVMTIIIGILFLVEYKVGKDVET